MRFVKFPEIENLHHVSHMKFFDDFQKMNNWVVTEKIDGSNCSVNISKEEIVLARRTAILSKDESFNNIYGTFETSELSKKFAKIQEQFDWTNVNQIIVYGEYFGKNIQRRIFYSNDYQFRFFGLAFVTDSEVIWKSFKELEDFLSLYDLNEYIVPKIGVFNTLDEALSVRNDEITTFQTENHHDIMEGVVIEPYFDSPVNEYGSYKIKNKNEKFEEKNKTRIKTYDSEEMKNINRLREEFKQYCTENRMYSVFSKEGIPTSEKDTGKFLCLFIEDAKKDFYKEHPDYSFTKSQEKTITNIGNLGYSLFKSVWNKMI